MRKLLTTSLFVVILSSLAWAQTSQQNSLLIRGKVLDDQGRPVSGAVVNASPDGGLRGRVPSAPSDSRGEFVIPVYKSDWFRVTASKPADGYLSTGNPFYYPIEDALAHVFVREGKASPFATVHLGPKAGTVAGRIVDAATGKAIEEAQITLCRAEVPKYCHRPAGKYMDGQFTFQVPASPFTVEISASGYKDWNGTEAGDQEPSVVQVASGARKVLSVSLERLPARAENANPSMLDAPVPLLPIDGAEFHHYPRTTRLEWSAVHGAASYTVELEVCQLAGVDKVDKKECRDPRLLQIRGNPPLSGIEGTTYDFVFIGSQPGRWRVWALDEKGRAGMKSGWSIFSYGQ